MNVTELYILLVSRPYNLKHWFADNKYLHIVQENLIFSPVLKKSAQGKQHKIFLVFVDNIKNMK